MGIVSVGQSVPRYEDPYLLRGEGRFTADVALPNQAYGYVLRSPHAMARINGIDTAKALAGHEVAFIVAETLAQARDAAELVAVDYEPLDALTDSFAVAAGAPAIGKSQSFHRRTSILALHPARI